MKEEVKEKEKPMKYTKPRLIDLQEEGLKPQWDEASGDCVNGDRVIDYCTPGMGVISGCSVGGTAGTPY